MNFIFKHKGEITENMRQLIIFLFTTQKMRSYRLRDLQSYTHTYTNTHMGGAREREGGRKREKTGSSDLRFTLLYISLSPGTTS